MEESRASVDITQVVKTDDPNLDAHTEYGSSMPPSRNFSQKHRQLHSRHQ
jgi:hypothetical protein